MISRREELPSGDSARPPGSRKGRLAVLAIIIFSLAFAVGGYFAVKAITASRPHREPAAGPSGPGPEKPSGKD